MGSTLEHGIYLPSEGEKNCYQGLASNWNKVDGALGDVAELRQLIENKFTKEIVTELPTEDINPYCIYMILKAVPETDNIYDEWVYINNSWEYLGNTKVDMTQYYTKQEVNQLPAVASGVTATKVGNYDAHIANGDIHVTASDKTKWTNSANTHVLRLALSALTPSTSDNSFSNLDDSTALKVGDKVMDTAGVLFEVTAIDTQNSTFTIGTALIDLAQDSDVVHNSGDETISGFKTFSSTIRLTAYPNIRMYLPDDEWNVQPATVKQSEIRFTDKNSVTMSYFAFQHRPNSTEPFRTCWRQQKMDGTSGYYSIAFGNLGNFYPENDITITLGTQSSRWKSVYATNYYYGLNNVEFSTKFVTTDTAQTISGNKTWSGLNTFQQNITYQRTNFFHQAVSPCYILKDTELEKGSLASTHTAYPGLWQDKNNNVLGYVRFVEYSSGRQTAEIRVSNLIKNGALDPTGTEDHCTVNLELQPSGEKSLIPERNNDINLGTSTNKWKTLNGVEPSSLSLPDIDNRIDISSYITDLSGVGNVYTPTVNGWISIRSANANKISILDSVTGIGNSTISNTATYLTVMAPVVANRKVILNVMCTSLEHAYFIPCQGNV